ncbi:MAG: hypothetical protein ACRENS_13595, partial [Candidatus Eiseniibacteriota bacterium]
AMLLAVDRVSVSPSRGLERGLAARLAERGVSLGGHRVTYVGLSPAGEARIYEGSGDWDLGFVALAGERLCYFGEEACFALERGRVHDVTLGAALPNWIRAPRVVVAWRDAAGDAHVFSLRPARVSSLGATAAAARALAGEIRAWQAGSGASEPDAFGPLALPTAGAVTSASPRELASAASLIKACVLVVILCGSIASALRLPLGLVSPGMLDAQLAAVLGLVFQRVPFWLPSGKAAAPAREKLERAA